MAVSLVKHDADRFATPSRHGVRAGPDGLVAGPFSYPILAVASFPGAMRC